jgi:hypothetical protein
VVTVLALKRYVYALNWLFLDEFHENVQYKNNFMDVQAGKNNGNLIQRKIYFVSQEKKIFYKRRFFGKKYYFWSTLFLNIGMK